MLQAVHEQKKKSFEKQRFQNQRKVTTGIWPLPVKPLINWSGVIKEVIEQYQFDIEKLLECVTTKEPAAELSEKSCFFFVCALRVLF